MLLRSAPPLVRMRNEEGSEGRGEVPGAARVSPRLPHGLHPMGRGGRQMGCGGGRHEEVGWEVRRWDGMGRDGMGRDGMGWGGDGVGMRGWDGEGWDRHGVGWVVP